MEVQEYKQYLHKADCGSKRHLPDLGHAGGHSHAHGTRVIGGNKVTAKHDNLPIYFP